MSEIFPEDESHENEMIKPRLHSVKELGVRTDGTVVTIIQLERPSAWESYVFADDEDDENQTSSLGLGNTKELASATKFSEQTASNRIESSHGSAELNSESYVDMCTVGLNHHTGQYLEQKALVRETSLSAPGNDAALADELAYLDAAPERFPYHLVCTHIDSVKPLDNDTDLERFIRERRCQSCGTDVEVWWCLVCKLQFCGRYQNSHMLEHFNDSAHYVAMNFDDLSIWCYGCDSYLQPEQFPLLSQFFSSMHYLKHSERPQNIHMGRKRRHYGTKFVAPNDKDGIRLPCTELDYATDVYKSVKDINQGCGTCAANNLAPLETSNAYREDWMCLTCGGVYCGRYHNKHGLHHFHVTGHPLALSFVDVSIWCYHCMEYIDCSLSQNLTGATERITALKASSKVARSLEK